MSLWDAFSANVQKFAPQAFTLNYEIANDPELSGQEYHACARHVAACRSLGMDVEEHFSGQPTAYKAVVKQPRQPALRVGILAEYDALPEIGHGCGHSAGGAVSFLAAAAFHAMPDLPVAVDLFGTPDEELHGGKVPMCEQGVFKDYDLVLMVHMSSCETTPNSRFLALDDYRVRFHGQTAHAAAHPWEGRNALNGATLSLHAIDMLRQHVLPDTRIGTYIVNGGTASNVIPDFAELECCIRHTTRTYLDQVVKRIMNCFAGAALATETTYEVEQVGYKYDDLIWNETATEVVRQVLREMKIPFVEPGIGGSSDIANISHQCPVLHLHLAMGDTFYPDHSREIADLVKSKTIEPVIVQGAEIIGRTVLRIAADPALKKAIRAEFDKSEK
ncbi:amidohydrolase [Megasphaera hominis]|jgi:amidohydrolase|uniref:Peptidase M20 domain-containing protein 2 n=1 Tax=Megasphaera hominis TaxID=159836 RepID=A0ABR6VHF2_9FIRM|nr:amidohydrolase [Megasphaera hominis]MBC3536636.1 amidohydrolase [Megasphaera hominis]